jgi:hypothetical protein
MNQAVAQHQTFGKQLDETKAYLGLTPKQYAYCDARAEGSRQSEAYRKAYDASGMADDDIRLAAWRLEQDTRIPQRINSLLASSREPSSLVPVLDRIEVSKDWVVQGIARLAVDERVKANTRLAAYIAVGKSAGVDAFRDIVVHEKVIRTVDQIDAEIARHLSNMIDVTPTIVGPKPTSQVKDRRRKPTP